MNLRRLSKLLGEAIDSGWRTGRRQNESGKTNLKRKGINNFYVLNFFDDDIPFQKIAIIIFIRQQDPKKKKRDDEGENGKAQTERENVTIPFKRPEINFFEIKLWTFGACFPANR